MEEIANIHWHDCEIESVMEVPSKDMLVLNVRYPEDWEQNVFVPKGIVFEGYHSQEVHEIFFEGSLIILDASVVSEADGFTIIRLETNAGYRLVTAKKVAVGGQIGSI